MGSRDGHPKAGELIRYRPETDEEWEAWLENRESARAVIRSYHCQEHPECKARSEELISALGLHHDNWAVEISV